MLWPFHVPRVPKGPILFIGDKHSFADILSANDIDWAPSDNHTRDYFGLGGFIKKRNLKKKK